ncbi:hypothetical protein KQY30_31565 [Streptomyces sp. GMY02]|uniref:hypothetical protein n=1 Tax=Streptomyces sp. GMY02 TaxID=1333528 RepID=UPI001C2B866A|nr:hypothetical protein [Streptomyces sp. GMY02]QXE38093.1 hypothetical protein KQY30_31565 [Streptomyces sp. GMY02]
MAFRLGLLPALCSTPARSAARWGRGLDPKEFREPGHPLVKAVGVLLEAAPATDTGELASVVDAWAALLSMAVIHQRRITAGTACSSVARTSA